MTHALAKVMDPSIKRIRFTGISALQQQEMGTDRNCPENMFLATEELSSIEEAARTVALRRHLAAALNISQ
jgi:hypothetical protein